MDIINSTTCTPTDENMLKRDNTDISQDVTEHLTPDQNICHPPSQVRLLNLLYNIELLSFAACTCICYLYVIHVHDSVYFK